MFFANKEAERVAPLPELAKNMRQEMQKELDTLPPFLGSEDLGPRKSTIKSTIGYIGHIYRVPPAVIGEYLGEQQQELAG